MDYKTFEELIKYFELKYNPTEQEKEFLDKLNNEKGYFPISSIHRVDLLSALIDCRKASDDDMEKLASKMADDYCSQLFHTHLPIIADIIGIPILKCPKCNSDNIDIEGDEIECYDCKYTFNLDKIRVYPKKDFEEVLNNLSGMESMMGYLKVLEYLAGYYDLIYLEEKFVNFLNYEIYYGELSGFLVEVIKKYQKQLFEKIKRSNLEEYNLLVEKFKELDWYKETFENE